eukprot:GFUD01076174.1.p1 GENE.GFUD01076174.1~~GFUD01076174.1.p1  ORF type:complete len:114 (-),score=15.79 GFUD01076174.1:177-494(-)
MKTITCILAVFLLACVERTMSAPRPCSIDDWICGGRWPVEYGDYDPVIINGQGSLAASFNFNNDDLGKEIFNPSIPNLSRSFQNPNPTKSCNGDLSCVLKNFQSE